MYGIEDEVGARIAEPKETDTSPREGYVAVYEWQVMNGLKFLICSLLKDIIKQYRVSISQILPLGICKVMAFEACCQKAGVVQM